MRGLMLFRPKSRKTTWFYRALGRKNIMLIFYEKAKLPAGPA